MTATAVRGPVAPAPRLPREWTEDGVLALAGRELAAVPGVELEFSVRLRGGAVEEGGRFACWLAGRGRKAFRPVQRLLRRLDAPRAVRAAQRAAEGPVRQAVAVAFDARGPEFRLYLHGRARGTLADHYRAWRWRPGAAPRRSTYTFHFLPETTAGERPADLVPAPLRPAVERLLRHERLRQASGFWLRRGEDGALEQVDLAFPWRPAAGSIGGMDDLAALLTLPADGADGWRTLPVRHVAVSAGPAAAPGATLYVSAPLRGAWPASAGELRQRVRAGAAALGRASEDVYRGLPPLPPADAAPPGLDAFYGGCVETWKTVLGDEMHYHGGLFSPAAADPDDAEMEKALRLAVTSLYPFIPAGGRVYDVGCGWGGPLAMWTRDLGCRSVGITISRTQFRHVAARGLPVRWGDAERTLPPGRFDCAVLLESLSHVDDKARLLRVLRRFAGRLVMRVNCQDAAPPGPAFGGSMRMVSSDRLRALVEEAGWRVTHWRDRRPEALATVAVWHRRLLALPPTRDRHLETLRAWCARVVAAPEAWARANPLIEVVAD